VLGVLELCWGCAAAVLELCWSCAAVLEPCWSRAGAVPLPCPGAKGTQCARETLSASASLGVLSIPTLYAEAEDVLRHRHSEEAKRIAQRGEARQLRSGEHRLLDADHLLELLLVDGDKILDGEEQARVRRDGKRLVVAIAHLLRRRHRQRRRLVRRREVDAHRPLAGGRQSGHAACLSGKSATVLAETYVAARHCSVVGITHRKGGGPR